MRTDPLRINECPMLSKGTMLLAFTGWMDGGDVSTGTVRTLITSQLEVRKVAHIDPEGFYIYNFPGSMEISALFRPHIKIEDGVVRSYDLPTNTFFCDEQKDLVLFIGREPNLNWETFGDCIFRFATTSGVKRILFVGSFGGTVPHTREPRLYATVSDPDLLSGLKTYGVRPSDYEGPGSFTSYLMTQVGDQGFDMVSLVAEIPAYLQGTNPICIEAVTRRLAPILGLKANLAELRGASDEWESKVSDTVNKDEELAEKIRELEKQYDDDLVNSPIAEAWMNDEGKEE